MHVTNLTRGTLSCAAAELENIDGEDISDVLGSQNNDWLQHIALNEGYRDPPGIRVRPMEGLEAIDFLVCARPSSTLPAPRTQ